jgi:hypothetical protein
MLTKFEGEVVVKVRGKHAQDEKYIKNISQKI